MNENSQYWKELLGDDYNEELMRILHGDPEGETPSGGSAAPPEPEGAPADDDEDARRFRDFDVAASRGAGQDTAGRISPEERIDDENTGGIRDFDVHFDFDGEYRDVQEKRPIRQRRVKRTGCLSGILYAVFIICVCTLLASLAWLAATDVLGFGDEDRLIQVTIPESRTIDGVTDVLHEAGLIKYKFLFKLYAGYSKADEKITAGTYELNANYDYRALVNGMTARGGKRVEVEVVIPEGYTLRQIIELLVANKVCREDELWEAAANYDFEYDFLDSADLGDKYRLEGYLFPDTYKFYVGDLPARALSKMLGTFRDRFNDDYTARAAELGYSVREIVIIASMIEKEAGSDSERATIASVLYNRLGNSGYPHLQIDATIHYAIAETGEAFSTSVDSPYNTYVQEGLPVGPIANPGLASIKAALYPESTQYYFYALNKSRTHNFFRDFASHAAFVASSEYGG